MESKKYNLWPLRGRHRDAPGAGTRCLIPRTANDEELNRRALIGIEHEDITEATSTHLTSVKSSLQTLTPITSTNQSLKTFSTSFLFQIIFQNPTIL